MSKLCPHKFPPGWSAWQVCDECKDQIEAEKLELATLRSDLARLQAENERMLGESHAHAQDWHIIAQLKQDLAEAKDARIEAMREAADLRLELARLAERNAWLEAAQTSPWAAFLEARMRVIGEQMRDGKTAVEIMQIIQVDLLQVRLLMQTVVDRACAPAPVEPPCEKGNEYFVPACLKCGGLTKVTDGRMMQPCSDCQEKEKPNASR